MAKDILKNPLKQILGNAAYSNRGEVPNDVKVMFQALYYLETQSSIMAGVEDEKERREYLDKILKSTAEMLSAVK